VVENTTLDIKLLDKVVNAVDEALELKETMMLNIEKTKAHYLLS